MLPDEPASGSLIRWFPSSSPAGQSRVPRRSPYTPRSRPPFPVAQPVSELPLQDLAGGVAGQLVHAHDLLRLLVAGELVPAEGDQLGLGHVGAGALLDDGNHV